MNPSPAKIEDFASSTDGTINYDELLSSRVESMFFDLCLTRDSRFLLLARKQRYYSNKYRNDSGGNNSANMALMTYLEENFPDLYGYLQNPKRYHIIEVQKKLLSDGR